MNLLLRTFSNSSPLISKRKPAQLFHLTFTSLHDWPHRPCPALSVTPWAPWGSFLSRLPLAIPTSTSSLGSCFSSLLLLSMQNPHAYSRPTLLSSEGSPDHCNPPSVPDLYTSKPPGLPCHWMMIPLAQRSDFTASPPPGLRRFTTHLLVRKASFKINYQTRTQGFFSLKGELKDLFEDTFSFKNVQDPSLGLPLKARKIQFLFKKQRFHFYGSNLVLRVDT